MPLRKTARRPQPAAMRARAAAPAIDEDYEEEDYGGESEPSMRFTHALFVVLVLHVIAVGGVFAFNSIKAKQSAEARGAKSAPAQEKTISSSQPQTPATAASPATAQAKPPAAQAAATKTGAAPEAPAGKTHTVAAGETLSKIASKYGVSVDAIEKANDITTLSVIRVGQMLIIPESKKAASQQTAQTTSPPAQQKPRTVISSVVKPAPGEKPADTGIKAKPEDFIASSKSPPAPGESLPETASSPKAPAAQPSPAKAETKPASSGESYTVLKGDNPYSIAKRLGVSYKKLLEVNGITDPTKIQIGQVLQLPQPGQ